MATHDGGPGHDTTPRRRGPSSGGLLLAFLLGVVLATLALVVFLGLGVATVDEAEQALDVTPQPTETPTAEPSAERASGPVPRSCVEAAEYNQTFTEAVDQIAVGVRDQDARTLQEALDAVQDAKPASEAASQQCRDLAEEGGTAPDATSEPGRDATAEPDLGDATAEPVPGDGTEDTGGTVGPGVPSPTEPGSEVRTDEPTSTPAP